MALLRLGASAAVRGSGYVIVISDGTAVIAIGGVIASCYGFIISRRMVVVTYCHTAVLRIIFVADGYAHVSGIGFITDSYAIFF